MANQRRLINENVSESVINITLNNLNDLQRFETEEFFVRGNPWHLMFNRTNKDANNVALGVFLHSNFKHESNKTYIIASCEVKLLSWKPHVLAHCENWVTGKYSLKSDNWGKESLILWNQLMDPEKGYVMDNKCKLKIKITATPLQDVSNEDWMKFETINSCDNCLQRKFRMKINKFSEFFGVAAPDIIFNDLSFYITVFRYENMLRIRLIKQGQSSCSASFSFRLISFGANIEPLRIEYNNQKFLANTSGNILYNFAKWEILIDPTKKFIQNDSFVIEIDLNVKLDDPKAKRRRTCEANECVSLSCPICFENLKDRPISSLSCGHVFCTACAKTALRTTALAGRLYAKCPTCNTRVTLKSLRPLYLPTE